MKPENILLDYNGHIALCDFGLCKLNMSNSDTTNTFCGTPEYLAPELLQGHGYTKCVDWWTLGVLLYEMLTGLPPYYDENTNDMYRKILQDPLRFPPEVHDEARSLLTALLNRDPSKRLGVNGAQEIKDHPFFSRHLDFKKLWGKKIQPPFKPAVVRRISPSRGQADASGERRGYIQLRRGVHQRGASRLCRTGFASQSDCPAAIVSASLFTMSPVDAAQ